MSTRKYDFTPETGDSSLVGNVVERTPAAKRSAVFKQLLLAAAVFLLAISAGMTTGFMFIQNVFEERFDYRPRTLGLGLFSWFMTKCGLLDPFASLLAGYLMDRKGRRFVCILAVCPYVISWPLFTIAPYPIFHNAGLMFAGQLFASFGIGLFWPSAQILLAECAQPELRGLLVATPFVGYTLGVLLTTALGAALSAPSLSFGPIVVPIIAAVCLWFVPESPAWLVRMEHHERAQAALIWLRGDEVTARRELAAISERLESEKSAASTSTFRPVTIILICYVVAMLAGINLATLGVISKVFGAHDFGSVSTVIHTVATRLIALLVVLVAVYTISRKKLLKTAIFVAAISSTALSAQTVFFGQDSYVNTPLGAYFAMSCGLIVIVASTVLLVCPLIMVSELLPAKGRGKWCGFCFCLIHIIYYVVTNVFLQNTINTTGVYGLSVVIGVGVTLGSILMESIMPEMRDLTLDQIEDFFVSGANAEVVNNV